MIMNKEDLETLVESRLKELQWAMEGGAPVERQVEMCLGVISTVLHYMLTEIQRERSAEHDD